MRTRRVEPHRTDAGNPGQIGVEKVEQVVQGSPVGHAAAAADSPPYTIRNLNRMNVISMISLRLDGLSP